LRCTPASRRLPAGIVPSRRWRRAG
jgi:hypothetical protein